MNLEQYRTGRNWVRVGDTVKVKFAGRNPFLGRVRAITGDDDGNATHVEVVIATKVNGAPHSHAGKWRIATPDEITRVAQTRVTRREEEEGT